MIGDTRDVHVVTVSTIPVARLVAIAMLLAASLLAMAVFDTGTGRYVPTGSVLGFQGPSYFYVTGLWTFVGCACMGVATVTGWREYKVRADVEHLTIGSRWFLSIGKRERNVPLQSIRVVTFRRHPGPGAIAGVVVGCGWTGFLLQLSIPTMLLPFSQGIQVTGIVLAVVASLVMACCFISAWRPGLLVSVIHDAGEEELRFPGTVRPGDVEATIASMLSKAGLDRVLPVGGDQVHPRGGLLSQKSVEWVVNVGIACFGLVADVLITTGLVLVPINHVIAWSLVCFGLLMTGVLKNEDTNARWMHSHAMDSRRELLHITRERLLVLPLAISMVAVGCAAYLAGKMAGMAARGATVPAVQIIVHAVLATMLMAWAVHVTLPRGDEGEKGLSGKAISPRIAMFSFSIRIIRWTPRPVSWPVARALLGVVFVGAMFLSGLASL